MARIVCLFLIVGAAIALTAADACYYGKDKKYCLSRIGDKVKLPGGELMPLTGELGIRFKDDTSPAKREKLLSLFALTPVEVIPGLPHYLKVRVKSGSDPFTIARRLVESGNAQWAQPIWYEKVRLLSTTPNDTYYGEAWHHAMVHSPEAWDWTTGDPRVIVAIVDSGVDTQHPDLTAHILWGQSFVPTEPYVDPQVSGTNFTAYSRAHGTAVSGVAVANGNNGIGVAGVCWNCSLLPVKYLGNEMIIPNDRKLTALTWTVDNGAWVINNSWLINQDKDANDVCKTNIPYDNYAGEAVAYGKTYGRGGRGTVMVFGAGNSACDTAANDNFKNLHGDILVVSALRSTGDITDYSNYGIYIDIAAPSGFDMADDKGLVTTDWTAAGFGYNPHFMNDLPDQAYTKFFSGTSGATPVVSGAIGLMLSVAPYLTHEEVIACVKNSASPGTQGCRYGDDAWCYGAGVLNVQAMVENARNGLCGGTPECTGSGDCGDGKDCWNGICVGRDGTTDDDVLPDDTMSDEEMPDNEWPDEAFGDSPTTEETTPDGTLLDETVTDETSLSDESPEGIASNEENLPSNEADILDESEGGCGCTLLF